MPITVSHVNTHGFTSLHLHQPQVNIIEQGTTDSYNNDNVSPTEGEVVGSLGHREHLAVPYLEHFIIPGEGASREHFIVPEVLDRSGGV